MFGFELAACPNLAVPKEIMHHVVRVESSYNPYAIGVVGGRLARQPKNLSEAVSTAKMLESRGYNFSLGLAQVNRYNLAKYGLTSYEHAFQSCANLKAGSEILAECHGRSGNHWGKAFSCYYSGNFVTGYRHGYVQKVYKSMQQTVKSSATPIAPADVISVASFDTDRRTQHNIETLSLVARRIEQFAAKANAASVQASSDAGLINWPLASHENRSMSASAQNAALTKAVRPSRIAAVSKVPSTSGTPEEQYIAEAKDYLLQSNSENHIPRVMPGSGNVISDAGKYDSIKAKSSMQPVQQEKSHIDDAFVF